MRTTRYGGRTGVVDFPDPETDTEFDYDQGDGGMPERTRRAFQAHADQNLGSKIQRAIEEIERVYESHPATVVATSGGKDSTTALALASEASVDHRALHWDYGPDLVPREYEQEIINNILDYVSRDDLLVAVEGMDRYEPYSSPAAEPFLSQLATKKRLSDWKPATDSDKKPILRSIRPLNNSRESDVFDRQIVALRRGESGKRDRKISGLYGESMGFPAAFPLRDWSARDVWAFIVDRGVSYPEHYDRAAYAIGYASPRDYEDTRMSAFFFEFLDPFVHHGVSAWRHLDLPAREWDE